METSALGAPRGALSVTDRGTIIRRRVGQPRLAAPSRVMAPRERVYFWSRWGVCRRGRPPSPTPWTPNLKLGFRRTRKSCDQGPPTPELHDFRGRRNPPSRELSLPWGVRKSRPAHDLHRSQAELSTAACLRACPLTCDGCQGGLSSMLVGGFLGSTRAQCFRLA